MLVDFYRVLTHQILLVIPLYHQTNKTQFKTVWDTNFTTAENLTRVGLNYLDKSNGVILFVSSITGIEALGAPTDYSTAKAALIALSKNLARKLAPGIRVNILPSLSSAIR